MSTPQDSNNYAVETRAVFSYPALVPFGAVQSTIRDRRAQPTVHSILNVRTFVPQALLGATLENLHCGVIVLDAEGAILFANRRARRILARADAMIADADQMRFLQSALQIRFAAYLKMRRSSPAEETSKRLVMRVPRKSGAIDYAMTVRPIDANLNGHIVYVYDFERDGLVQEVLNHVYGLTEAEAQLATHLYNGQSVQATAHTMRIRESTARAHLTKVMSKCGVRSLSELLQRLALGPSAQK